MKSRWRSTETLNFVVIFLLVRKYLEFTTIQHLSKDYGVFLKRYSPNIFQVLPNVFISCQTRESCLLLPHRFSIPLFPSAFTQLAFVVFALCSCWPALSDCVRNSAECLIFALTVGLSLRILLFTFHTVFYIRFHGKNVSQDLEVFMVFEQ